MNPDMLAVRLSELRARRGWTLRDLGDACGVSHGYINKMESGKADKPSYDVLRRLALTLDVSVAYLVGDEERP